MVVYKTLSLKSKVSGLQSYVTYTIGTLWYIIGTTILGSYNYVPSELASTIK